MKIQIFKAKPKSKLPMLMGASGCGYSQDYYFAWNGVIRKRRKIKESAKELADGKSYEEIYPFVDFLAGGAI